MTEERDKFNWLFAFIFFCMVLPAIVFFIYGIIRVAQANRTLEEAEKICNHEWVIPITQEEYTQINADRKGLLLYLVNQRCGIWNDECKADLLEDVELFLQGVK